LRLADSKSRSLDFAITSVLNDNKAEYNLWEARLVESEKSFALNTPIHQIFYVE